MDYRTLDEIVYECATCGEYLVWAGGTFVHAKLSDAAAACERIVPVGRDQW